MRSSSWYGHDTMGYSASSMQLSLVVKSPEGRDGAAGITSHSNNPDAVLTAWATGLAGSILTGKT